MLTETSPQGTLTVTYALTQNPKCMQQKRTELSGDIDVCVVRAGDVDTPARPGRKSPGHRRPGPRSRLDPQMPWDSPVRSCLEHREHSPGRTISGATKQVSNDGIINIQQERTGSSTNDAGTTKHPILKEYCLTLILN